MERLGLGYEDVKAVNPQIIYVALVGFGQDGPYARRPAYDDVIQGGSGMADMQGGRTGVPKFVNSSICDKIGSQFAVHSTMAALFSRERTGEGQMVEVPMLESLVGFNLVEHQAGHTFEPPLGPPGYERTMAEHRRPYATNDGYVCVLPYNTKQWCAFFKLMDRPDMLEDPRVLDSKTRSEKIGELYEMVSDCVAGWNTEELLAALGTADIPNGRAIELGDLVNDPHLEAVGLIERHEHPTEGTIRMTNPGMNFSKTPASVRTLPDLLGEHSVDVLREIGLDENTVASMLNEGATLDGRLQLDEAAAQ
jgi:crotonobetainyl-CoA:carnitine CoA-transferase CaiB-like acyl-CoA transferase